MGLEKAERMYNEIKKCLSQITTDVHIDTVLQLNKLISDLFVVDVEYAINKGAETHLWKLYHSLINSVTSSKDVLKSKDNVLNMVISWMIQFSQILHMHYLLVPNELPSSFTVSVLEAGETKQKLVKDSFRCKIIGFIALRMGDLLRYKGDLRLSEKLYQVSLNLQPQRGEIWNQLGLMSNLKANFHDAVYYYVRALHAPVVFEQASTNISTILRKYSKNDDTSDDAPFREMYLTALGRIHFMLSVSPKLVNRLGPLLLNVRLIAPFISTYSLHDGTTDDEKRSKTVIEQLLRLSYQETVRKFQNDVPANGTELLSCLSLLLRIPAVCHTNGASLSTLEECSSLFIDLDHLKYFSCLEDPLKHPFEWNQFLRLLAPIQKKDSQTTKQKEKSTERERRRRRTVLVAPLQ